MAQHELFERTDKGVPGAVWWSGNWQCRNKGGFLQDREAGTGPWSFVIYGFGDTDCSVYGIKPDGSLTHVSVPIDAQNRITIRRRKYGRSNWRH